MRRRSRPPRRYLVPFEAADLPQRTTDVLVIGSGIAGLRAALAAAAQGAKVLVVTKGDATASNTGLAQGGIAAALAPGDGVAAHVEDTLRTGGGIGEPRVVRRVVADGVAAVKELIGWGARFDRERGRLAFTTEGGHTRARVLHADGDATGRELMRTLLGRVRETAGITLLEHCFVIDLLGTPGAGCQGALIFDVRLGRQAAWARRTILATGGAGRVWRETTNPEVATGDGLAMALRAGLALEDVEFMQFHPTALYVAGAARHLVSEAVRGEGAYLRDADGVRFMVGAHPLEELAPRDVVSRAIVRRLRETGHTCAYLDLSHLPARRVRARFPGISAICRSFDIDIARDPIPVRPAAHYMVGGIHTDERGRTALRHLYACGEAASTGLHGANRLASNSLLEGLVLGRAAGAHAGREALRDRSRRAPPQGSSITPRHRGPVDVADVAASLRALMWRDVGVERTGAALAGAEAQIAYWQGFVLDQVYDFPGGWELQDMLLVARAVARAARWREETRGVHCRTDFPEVDDRRFRRHSRVCATELG